MVAVVVVPHGSTVSNCVMYVYSASGGVRNNITAIGPAQDTTKAGNNPEAHLLVLESQKWETKASMNGG